MKTYNIAVIGGDGTGPEVTAEAVKVMDVAAAKFGFKVEKTDYDFGGERYKRTGEILPDGAIAELKKHSAIRMSNPVSLKKACCWACGSHWINISTCALCGCSPAWNAPSKTKDPMKLIMLSSAKTPATFTPAPAV